MRRHEALFRKKCYKDMGENSKEEFDFEYDKIDRHGKVNGNKQKDFISQI